MSDYEKFNALFRYDPETGHLYWKRAKGRRRTDVPAGHVSDDGYCRICVEYKMYLAHRIVWLLHHKEWPKGILDHVDRNRRNNRIENLIDSNHASNAFNSKVRSDNKTGVPGVYQTPSGRYAVNICGEYWGSYESLSLAKKIAESRRNANPNSRAARSNRRG